MKTRTRADKAVAKVKRIVGEIKNWKGEAPTVVRVHMPDYLAMTEVGYIKDGKLSGTDLEIKPG